MKKSWGRRACLSEVRNYILSFAHSSAFLHDPARSWLHRGSGQRDKFLSTLLLSAFVRLSREQTLNMFPDALCFAQRD